MGSLLCTLCWEHYVLYNMKCSRCYKTGILGPRVTRTEGLVKVSVQLPTYMYLSLNQSSSHLPLPLPVNYLSTLPSTSQLLFYPSLNRLTTHLPLPQPINLTTPSSTDQLHVLSYPSSNWSTSHLPLPQLISFPPALPQPFNYPPTPPSTDLLRRTFDLREVGLKFAAWLQVISWVENKLIIYVK